MADYSKEVEDTKEYYANLLILQYHSKYRARETVKIGVDLYLGDGVVFELQDILDIDNAEGKQLDLIGKILDCPRLIPGFETDKPFFTFKHTDDDYGFSTIGQPSQGYFKSLNFDYSSVYSLPDNDYRILLKFKAIANRARASWAGIDEIFYSVFGDSITITNNKNLSITYNILQSAVTDGLLAAIKLNYLEPPMGIGYNINYLQYNENAFTKVGNPIVTSDGIASGFSGSSYFTLPDLSILGTANNWEINCKFTTGTVTTPTYAQHVFIINENEYSKGVQMQLTQNSKLRASIGAVDGTAIIGGNNIINLTATANTTYWWKISFNGSTYTSKYSLDGTNYTTLQSVNSSKKITTNLNTRKIGQRAGGVEQFLGSIDLKQFSITVDGAIVLSGKQIY